MTDTEKRKGNPETRQLLVWGIALVILIALCILVMDGRDIGAIVRAWMGYQ